MDFVPNDGLHKYSLQTHMHKYMYMCVIMDRYFISNKTCLYYNKTNSPIYVKHNKSEIKLVFWGMGNISDKYTW